MLVSDEHCKLVSHIRCLYLVMTCPNMLQFLYYIQNIYFSGDKILYIFFIGFENFIISFHMWWVITIQILSKGIPL